MAILILATLRSPFLPQGYGTIPALWLLTLLGSTFGTTWRALAGVLVTWAVLCAYWPIDRPIDPRWLAVTHTVPIVLMLILVFLVLRRARDGARNAV